LHEQTLEYPEIIYPTKNHFLRYFYLPISISPIITKSYLNQSINH